MDLKNTPQKLNRGWRTFRETNLEAKLFELEADGQKAEVIEHSTQFYELEQVSSMSRFSTGSFKNRAFAQHKCVRQNDPCRPLYPIFDHRWRVDVFS